MSRNRRASKQGPSHLRLALLAASLAAGGVLVAALGERLGQPVLEDRVGPVLTLIGAGIWLIGRFRRRGGQDEDE